jgi:predicted N-acetyltransferase YhbS
MPIRRARKDDAAELSKIAHEAKAQWGYPASWLKQWRESLTLTPEFIGRNETFVLEEVARPVAFYSLCRDGDKMRLEHLWVSPNKMNRGIGRKLFRHAAERATALGSHCLTIESDPHAEAFYLRLGAIRSGTVVSEIEGKRREIPLLTLRLTSKEHEQAANPSAQRD